MIAQKAFINLQDFLYSNEVVFLYNTSDYDNPCWRKRRCAYLRENSDVALIEELQAGVYVSRMIKI